MSFARSPGVANKFQKNILLKLFCQLKAVNGSIGHCLFGSSIFCPTFKLTKADPPKPKCYFLIISQRFSAFSAACREMSSFLVSTSHCNPLHCLSSELPLFCQISLVFITETVSAKPNGFMLMLHSEA